MTLEPRIKYAWLMPGIFMTQYRVVPARNSCPRLFVLSLKQTAAMSEDSLPLAAGKAGVGA